MEEKLDTTAEIRTPFIRTNKTGGGGGGGGGEKALSSSASDWMMLIGFRMVPKYEQCDAKRSHDGIPITIKNAMRERESGEKTVQITSSLNQ